MRIWAVLALAVLLAATIVVVAIAGEREKDARNTAAGIAPTPVTEAAVSTAAAPKAPARNVVVIGDSYTYGSDEGGRGKAGWPHLVEQDLDSNGMPTSITAAAVGGIGYLASNESGVDFGKIAAKVTETETTRAANLVMVFGSRNDITYPPEKVAEAARAVYAMIHSAMPDAKLIVIGPEWQSENAPAQMLAVRDAIAAEATAAGAEFIDPISEQWFNVAQPDLIGKDNIHPTDAGHKKMASVLFPIIRTALEETTQ